MKKLNNYNGYTITPTDWGYYIVIASEKHNQIRHYEYSGGCGTLEQVEKELQANDFGEIAKRYREQCVYCECVEQIY